MTANQKLTHIIQRRVVKLVQQADTDLLIHFEDGSTLNIKLAQPTDSVLVRDAKGKIEYVD